MFKSGASILPGTEFAGILLRQAAACEIMTVLMGPEWLSRLDEKGQRRLDRENDWVRTEIATAFRAGNHVVPVLLGEPTMLPDANVREGGIGINAGKDIHFEGTGIVGGDDNLRTSGES